MNSEQKTAVGHELVALWEEAWLAQAADAACGRLFRGVIHNLNGVLQVASLHAEMSILTLKRAEELLAPSGETVAPRGEQAAELANLLAGQQDAALQLREKTRQGNDILHRVSRLPALIMDPAGKPQSSGGEAAQVAWSLYEILRCELEFLSADPFFKHKISKDITPISEELPAAVAPLAAHQVLHILLSNALEALVGRDDPRLEVSFTRAERESAGLEVVVGDNGPGLEPARREQLFTPFFSTKEGHRGLGLYLARKLAVAAGGTLECLEVSDGAAFRLFWPYVQS